MIMPPRQDLTPPPPPAAPPATTLQARIDGLQTQLLQTDAQIASLQDQQRFLSDQVRHGRAEMRAEAAPRLVDVRASLADAQARRALIQAQLAQLGVDRQTSGYMIHPNTPRQRMDPDLAAGIVFSIIFAVLMPISIGIARKIWRSAPRQTTPQIDPLLGQRMERLEQAVDAIAIEIERISESQRFMTKVMTDRAPTPAGTQSRDAGAHEGKPILALGAGPIEPIRVAERQGVRPSITPH